MNQEARLYHSKGMKESWVGAHLSVIRVERLLGNHTDIFENWVCLRLLINTAWLNQGVTDTFGTWSGYCSLRPSLGSASVAETSFLGKFSLDLLLLLSQVSDTEGRWIWKWMADATSSGLAWRIKPWAPVPAMLCVILDKLLVSQAPFYLWNQD